MPLAQRQAKYLAARSQGGFSHYINLTLQAEISTECCPAAEVPDRSTLIMFHHLMGLLMEIKAHGRLCRYNRMVLKLERSGTHCWRKQLHCGLTSGAIAALAASALLTTPF